MRLTFISAMVVASSVLLPAGAATRYDRAAEKLFSGTIKAVVSYPAPDGSVGVHFLHTNRNACEHSETW